MQRNQPQRRIGQVDAALVARRRKLEVRMRLELLELLKVVQEEPSRLVAGKP